MFSSKSFILSSLRFGSLILFESIFVYQVRECSNFILLHVAVQFFQCHLLKRLSFFHCTNIFFLFCHMLGDHKFMGLSPVSLIYISVSVLCHTVLMTVAL